MTLVLIIIVFTITIRNEILLLKFNDSNVITHKRQFTNILYSISNRIQTSCIIEHEDNDLLQLILEMDQFSNNSKYIFSENRIAVFPKYCDYFFMLEMPDTVICNLFSKHKQTYLNLSYFIIIINIHFSLNMDKLSGCVSVFDSANVGVLSLQNDTFFMLSSALHFPRQFISANPKEFLVLSVESLAPLSLRGVQLKITSFHNPPYTMIRHINNSVVYDGMEFNFFKELAGHLNFTWRMIELSSDEFWGNLLANGTVVGGVVQTLRNQEADIAICNLWQRPIYIRDVEFSPPLNMIYLTFLVRRPYQLSSRWQSFYQLFTVDVWVTTLVVFIAITVAFWFGQNISSHTSKKMSLMEAGLVIFGILTVSASYIGSHRLVTFNTRSVIMWWFLFTILFTTALMSCIVTHLTLPLYSSRIDTIQQLVENDFYWSDPTYHNHKTTLSKFYFNLNDSWQKKFEARYRYIDPVEVEHYIKTDEKLTWPCQWFDKDFINVRGFKEDTDLSHFRVMRQHVRETYTSFALRKQSPFNKPTSRAILRMLSHGIWQYWRHKFANHSTIKRYLYIENDLKIFQKPEQLTLGKLYPIFFVLIVGLALACFVFLFELAYYTAEPRQLKILDN